VTIALAPLGHRGGEWTELHVRVFDEAIGRIAELLLSPNLEEQLIEAIVVEGEARARRVGESHHRRALGQAQAGFEVAQPGLSLRDSSAQVREIDREPELQ
jgi:hypothetical protein